MKLLLRRNQKSGMISSKITFTLDVRAELTGAEQDAVRKYKMGDTMLYQKMEMTDRGSGLLGIASRLAFKMINISVSVADLVNGTPSINPGNYLVWSAYIPAPGTVRIRLLNVAPIDSPFLKICARVTLRTTAPCKRQTDFPSTAGARQRKPRSSTGCAPRWRENRDQSGRAPPRIQYPLLRSTKFVSGSPTRSRR